MIATQLELLNAELEALNLWDRMFADDPNPPLVDQDACTVRFYRRAQAVAELARLDTKLRSESHFDVN